MTVRIITGDARVALRAEPAASVHMVVSSPPYWGLRDYQVEPGTWGGDAACAHQWDAVPRRRRGGPHGDGVMLAGGRAVIVAQAGMKAAGSGDTCALCGAWRGALGLEPDYRMYVRHVVEVFREVRRVLRPDGTLWLNLGDCYATGAGAVGERPGGGDQGDRWAGTSGRGHRGQHLPEYAGKAAARLTAMGPMTQPNRLPQPGLKAKDLAGIPWRVAFALQDDGWWLRQDIIWAKPNPMPESITDRCTKAHEYLFLLTPSETYFYDADAIAEAAEAREPNGAVLSPHGQGFTRRGRASGLKSHKAATAYEAGAEEHRTKAGLVEDGGTAHPTRNKRSVWTVSTTPFPEAHFATFPPALVEPCVLAGTSARGCCVRCGAGWRRVVAVAYIKNRPSAGDDPRSRHEDRLVGAREMFGLNGWQGNNLLREASTIGWYPTCRCDGLPALARYPRKPKRDPSGHEAAHEARMEAWRSACRAVDDARAGQCGAANGIRTAPAVVLDPFGGAGTVGLVADRNGRDGLIVELKPEYAEMAWRRIHGDSPLFAKVAAE